MRVRPRRGRRPALARWQGRVSTVSHTRPNHSPVSQPAPRLRGPPHAPNQSPVSLRRPVCGGLVPPAPYVFARTPAPIYCYLLLLLGLLPYLLPSNRLIILYVLAPTRPYVPAVLYTMIGCACRVKLRMAKGVVFFFLYRTVIRSGLTYIILGAIRTYLQY